MNSKTQRQFRLCGARNGARKRGEEHAQILIENLPGDTTQEEVKKMFEGMRGNIYLDLRSDHGRQAKDKDGAWTRTCHANIRCSEVSAALKATELLNGAVLRRGHRVKISIKHLHDDVWFWVNKSGAIDVYAINISCYEFLSIVIEYDSSIYFVQFSKEFSSLKRMVSDEQIIAVIPPSIHNDTYTENNDVIQYTLLCSLKRIDYRRITMESLPEKEVPKLLIYREVNILAQHSDAFQYLLPFGIDNDLSDMLLSMDIMDQLRDCNNDCYRSSDNSCISVLCSQGPRGTFSHSKGGYINSYDFACPIGTPVIAPREGIITDITDHHKKHGTDLVFEKKCNYVTILHADGSQCDLVHLRYKSIQFEKGDYVKAGDLIAYSGNTGFSGEPHIHMMVYVNRLVEDAVHWQSIPIKFNIDPHHNPCTLSTEYSNKPMPGHRYIQHIKSLYLDPLLIPSDRIQCNTTCHANWNMIDYTPTPHTQSDIMIRNDANNVLYYTVADLSTLQSDMIIVPLSREYIMNDWLSCRVMRRGGTKLMKELMKRGYDLLHTVGLKKSKQHQIRYDNDNESIFVLSGYDQLPCKRVMFVVCDSDGLDSVLMNDVFEYLCQNHDQVTTMNQQSYVNPRRLNHIKIETIGIELPLFNTSDATLIPKLERQLKGIRNGLIKYIEYVTTHGAIHQEWTMKQWFICAQSLHDLHSYSEYIGAWFPRKASVSRTHCVYVPHCPCGQCSARRYGLGKLHEVYKIKLHQQGIENDSCSGVDDEYLYLRNVYNPGEPTPHKPFPTPPPQMEIEDAPERLTSNKKEYSESVSSTTESLSNASEDDLVSTTNDNRKRKRNHNQPNGDLNEDHSDDDVTFISPETWSRQRKQMSMEKPRKRRKLPTHFGIDVPELPSTHAKDPDGSTKATTKEIGFDYHTKVNKNILQCLKNSNYDPQFIAKETRTANVGDHQFGSSHLMSLIAQQSQLDLHTQRCLIYQQFQRWRYRAEGKNLLELQHTHEAELNRLQMLRTMQYTQQIAFQKSKKNNQMIIGEKHGVVGSKEHMNCIPLTPRVMTPSGEDQLSYMIQCVAPQKEYYMNTLSKINLNSTGFAQAALEEMKQKQIAQQMAQQQQLQAEQRRRLQIQQQVQAEQMRIQIQQRQQQQQQQLQTVNADNFAKVQNIINMIVKNKMAFCSAKITSDQHAIHHVTNCGTCMGTLERAKGTLFK